MTTEPLETAELLAFARVAEQLSFSRAAAELGVPRATLGRRLARLEERVGARLLRRTTRSLRLTDAGQALYLHAQRVLDAVEAAEASVHQSEGRISGVVRVSAPPRFDTVGFADFVEEFAQKYPEVRVYLHFASRHVDLARDGYDVAIRAGTSLPPGVVAKTLSRARLLAVAAPSYRDKNGLPSSPRQLARHRCLVGYDSRELPLAHWPLRRGSHMRVEGAFYCNDLHVLLHMALAGMGIALLPGHITSAHIERGELVPVLAKSLGADSRLVIAYPERELMPPQVRAFVDAVSEWGNAAMNLGLLPRASQPRKRGRAAAR